MRSTGRQKRRSRERHPPVGESKAHLPEEEEGTEAVMKEVKGVARVSRRKILASRRNQRKVKHRHVHANSSLSKIITMT